MSSGGKGDRMAGRQKPRGGRMAPAKVNAVEGQLTALQLRQRGWTYQEIGDALGITKQNAYKRVETALRPLQEELKERVTIEREADLTRIGEMLKALWPASTAGDPASIDRVTKLLDRRAKLLGLDTPVKVEHSGELALTGDDARAALLARVAGAAGETDPNAAVSGTPRGA